MLGDCLKIHQSWLCKKRALLCFCASPSHWCCGNCSEGPWVCALIGHWASGRHKCKTVSTRMFTGLRFLSRTTVETCRQGESPAVELRWWEANPRHKPRQVTDCPRKERAGSSRVVVSRSVVRRFLEAGGSSIEWTDKEEANQRGVFKPKNNPNERHPGC